MAGDRDHEDKVLSRVIFQNDDYILRYEGPDPAMVSRVVVTFPDLIHPAGPDAEGWGAAFLRKRGAAVLSLNFVQPDWYQGAGFFPALDADVRFSVRMWRSQPMGRAWGGMELCSRPRGWGRTEPLPC
ncbi:MAG: hypothetical protein P8X69_12115, partial [Maritimibacter sp.]